MHSLHIQVNYQHISLAYQHRYNYVECILNLASLWAPFSENRFCIFLLLLFYFFWECVVKKLEKVWIYIQNYFIGRIGGWKWDKRENEFKIMGLKQGLKIREPLHLSKEMFKRSHTISKKKRWKRRNKMAWAPVIDELQWVNWMAQKKNTN